MDIFNAMANYRFVTISIWMFALCAHFGCFFGFEYTKNVEERKKKQIPKKMFDFFLSKNFNAICIVSQVQTRIGFRVCRIFTHMDQTYMTGFLRFATHLSAIIKYTSITLLYLKSTIVRFASHWNMKSGTEHIILLIIY